MYRQVLQWQPGHSIAVLNLAQLLLRRDAADEEAQELLRDAGQAQLIPEMRLELLFYGVVYGVAGFEDGPAEIKSLLDSGVRIPAICRSTERGG
jgi:hypothetical protein